MAFDACDAQLRRNGDLRGLIEQLYQEYSDPLHRYLLLSGSSAEDADEFLQEAFLRLFRFLGTGNKVEKPWPWLLRVTHNIRLDTWRRQQRKNNYGEADVEAQLDRVVDGALDPEAAVLAQERYGQLQKGFSRLTDCQYQYLLLRLEGLKFREIAEIHGVAVQTVAKACARAIEQLGRLNDE